MPVFEDRTLLVKPAPEVKITKRLVHRRAQEISALFGCQVVEVLAGSQPQDLPWKFTFYRTAAPVASRYRVLVLRINGTRGQVYTALGNYLHGAEGMRELFVRDGFIS